MFDVFDKLGVDADLPSVGKVHVDAGDKVALARLIADRAKEQAPERGEPIAVDVAAEDPADVLKSDRLADENALAVLEGKNAPLVEFLEYRMQR